MTAITIRKLPEDAKQRLRMRAAEHGRSMEAEARDILLHALGHPDETSWVEQLLDIGDRYGGVELEIPEDEPAEPWDFVSHPEP